MAPFRRGRSSQPTATSVDGHYADENGVGLGGSGVVDEENKNENFLHGNNNNNTTTATTTGSTRVSAWEARRRRKGGKNVLKSSTTTSTSPAPTRSTSSRRKNKEPLPDDEYDPYDSDPGESYREHCERIQGERSKSCLTMPRFLKDNKNLLASLHKLDRNKVGNANGIGNGSGVDPKSVSTSPPSPFQSELDDGFTSPLSSSFQQQQQQSNGNHLPASLPRDLARVQYSLRTSIGDGTHVQPSLGSQSLMERRELRPNNVHINVSHWSDFGGRNYMEDRYVIEDMGAVQVEVSPISTTSSSLKSQSSFEAGVEVTFGQRKNRRLKMPLTWLGIFDGHGGDKASQYCSDWLSSYVRNEESYPFDLGYAMKNAFTTIDEDFVATGHPDGSTACAATLVGGRRIVCANAGDSRAIVVRKDGTVVRLSRDHKPGMPDETRRISELGGRVIYWGRWRVEGLLAVSRSIGDASLKPYVCADPEVCEYDIGKDDWFLIMSSDGVWDVMDNEEAAHVVIASSCVMEEGKLKIDTNRFKWAARNLCDHAKSCGSTDNFSVIVVDLKSCGNPQAKSGRYLP